MNNLVKAIGKRIFRINTSIVLFALCIIVFCILLLRINSFGLSFLVKDIVALFLIAGLILIPIMVALLAYFKSDALLMSGEQILDLAKLQYGDSETKLEYKQGEVLPQKPDEAIEDMRNEAQK